jgi:glycosyltransferase involved in cell wall biosynthesis
MQRIKILLVITKLELGGAQKQLLKLIAGLDKIRFEPYLFTAEEGLLIPDAEAVPGLEIKKSKYLERSLNPLKDILAFLEIRAFIKSNKIDIVHTHSSKAGILGRWAARSAGVKNIIHTVHGWSFNDYQHPAQKNALIALEKTAAKFTSRLIVVCQHDKICGLKNRIGKEAKYSIITYAIRHEEFSLNRKGAKEELGFSPQHLVVGMVSCLKPQKSPQDFIRLAYLGRDIVPQLRFVLVGDGPLRKDVERLIDKLNLEKQVLLVGWRRDIPRLLAAFDILALTSLWEGLPIVALEAMAASLAVIVTDTGGVAEVVRDGETGFLVLRGDIVGMRQRLALLLKDAALREKLGEAARNSIASSFHLGEMVRKHADLYSALITEGASCVT